MVAGTYQGSGHLRRNRLLQNKQRRLAKRDREEKTGTKLPRDLHPVGDPTNGQKPEIGLRQTELRSATAERLMEKEPLVVSRLPSDK